MKSEGQKGSITVEATLFLPLFLFAFLSIYNLVYFARAQLIMQYAADQAAREVAQYTYILSEMGILEAMDATGGTAADLKSKVESVKNNLEIIEQAAENASKGEDVIQNAVSAGEAFQDAYDTVNGYVEDPQSFLNGILAVVKEGAADGISKYMVNTLAKSCVEKQLSIAGGTEDVEAYKNKLGISNMKMSRTSWCRDQSRDIQIVIDFDMTSRLPFFELEPRHYRVCASTRVWSGV